MSETYYSKESNEAVEKLRDMGKMNDETRQEPPAA